MLEFSSLGFVAKLFRDHTVAQLAAFFKEFYREHPVDFLLQYYLQLLDGESGKHTRIPTIFIHKGTHSSLHGKKQLLEVLSLFSLSSFNFRAFISSSSFLPKRFFLCAGPLLLLLLRVLPCAGRLLLLLLLLLPTVVLCRTRCCCCF
eukprot:m.117583 g.117583  ORF g.117583 m.117583 type:complete len:147 (+) comp51974_c0_seq18:867-1307(+)